MLALYRWLLLSGQHVCHLPRSNSMTFDQMFEFFHPIKSMSDPGFEPRSFGSHSWFSAHLFSGLSRSRTRRPSPAAGTTTLRMIISRTDQVTFSTFCCFLMLRWHARFFRVSRVMKLRYFRASYSRAPRKKY